MVDNKSNRMFRLPDVRETTGFCKSSIYGRIKRGLLPPPVHIGERASGWPSAEINTIVAAQIAGKSEDVIRALVSQLIEDRKTVFRGNETF